MTWSHVPSRWPLGCVLLAVLLCGRESYAASCKAPISVTPHGAFEFPSIGGSSFLLVTVGSPAVGRPDGGTSCHWRVATSAFITASPKAGDGDVNSQATVSFRVGANPDLVPRTGVLVVTQIEDGTTATVSITQEASVGDFSLAVSPPSSTVVPGTSGSMTVSLQRSNGFQGAIFLSTAGLPSYVTPTFSNVEPDSATLTLRVSANAPVPSDVPFTIQGVHGNLTRTTLTHLDIRLAPDLSVSAAPIVRLGSQ